VGNKVQSLEDLKWSILFRNAKLKILERGKRFREGSPKTSGVTSRGADTGFEYSTLEEKRSANLTDEQLNKMWMDTVR